MDDPLSALAEGAPARSGAAAGGAAGGGGGGGGAGETVFRQVDASKMKDRPIATVNKQAAAVAAAAASPQAAAAPGPKAELGAAKGLGFGVDLWGDAGAAKPKSAATDFLVDSSSSATLDAGIFHQTGAGVASPAAKTRVVNEQSTGKVRVGVAVASDESQLGDLTMATRLLEREEELDYATFGKTQHAQQLRETVVAKVQGGATRGDLELESEDVLRRMEGALAASQAEDASLFKTTAAPAAASASAAVAPKPVDVDLASLDLNSYIASQEQSGGGGGGLFD